jgi:hypothetical protein
MITTTQKYIDQNGKQMTRMWRITGRPERQEMIEFPTTPSEYLEERKSLLWEPKKKPKITEDTDGRV